MYKEVLERLIKIEEKLMDFPNCIDVEYICYKCGYHGTENEYLGDYIEKVDDMLMELIRDMKRGMI